MPYFFVFMAKSNDRKAAYSISLQLIEAGNNGVLFCIGMLVIWIASFLAMTRSVFGVGSCGLLRYARNDAKRAWGRSPEYWIASCLAMTRSDNKGSASLRLRLRERWVWVDGDSLREISD